MPAKPSKRPAERVVRKILADGTIKEYRYPRVAGKRAPRASEGSLGALILAYRRSQAWAGMRPISRKNRERYLRDIEAVHFLPLREFTRRRIVRMRDEIATGRGDGAASSFIAMVSRLLSWAVEAGYLEVSPANGITRPQGGHLRAWTDEEADIAQAELPEHLRRVVILARYTGQRRGDLCAMRWAQYDGATIKLRQQKDKRGRAAPMLTVPVHDALKAEMDTWGREHDTILVSERGRPWQPTYISHNLPAALRRIGLDEGLNVHGLRKLAAASLAQAGCSVHEIAAITGHRTLSMVQLYADSADQGRLAAAAMNRWQKPPG